MTDINLTNRPVVEEPSFPSEDEVRMGIELLFFAYRDFTGDPDALLEADGLGRAHHRVIHFVGRNPGITVAELLSILRITKQSLSRVLKQLLASNLVKQEKGPRDRRQRLLYLTEAGQELQARLSAPQQERVADALRKAGPEAAKAYLAVLLNMINEEDRSDVLKMVQRRTP